MVLIDTLAYAKALEEGGADKKLAETHARALAKLLDKIMQYKNTDQSSPQNRTEATKHLITSVLDYARELINANEKPQVPIITAKTLINSMLI